jgi:hypothetical protein
MWMMAALAVPACAVGETEEDGVTFATYPPMTSPMMTTATSGDGSTAGEATSTEGEQDGSTASVSDGSGSGTDGPGASSGDDAPLATDTGADNGMQPVDGMYSDCLSAAMCVGLNTCITILDTENMPIDGFCTNNACVAPATDCDVGPGGTAVPFCMMVQLNGRPDTACALDCSGGKTCPGGMMCWELGRTSVCA